MLSKPEFLNDEVCGPSGYVHASSLEIVEAKPLPPGDLPAHHRLLRYPLLHHPIPKQSLNKAELRLMWPSFGMGVV